MQSNEIVKRFTLHDLLGYFFSGALLIGSAWLLSNCFSIHDSGIPSSLVLAFRKLHLSTQVAAMSVLAYFLGLVSTALGDKVFHSAYPSRKDATRTLDKEQWKVEESPKVRELLVENTQLLLGTKKALTDPEMMSLAYSYLMYKKNDAFVQLMSGRRATYNGLTGAIILNAMMTITVFFNVENMPSWPIAVIFAASLVIGIFSVRTSRSYERWWNSHVIFGFLAMRNDISSDADSADGEKNIRCFIEMANELGVNIKN